MVNISMKGYAVQQLLEFDPAKGNPDLESRREMSKIYIVTLTNEFLDDLMAPGDQVDALSCSFIMILTLK